MKLGVLGGGQLGRMLALAAYPLDIRPRFYDSAADAPAGQLAPLTVGAFEDHGALAAFARGLDCVTYEFENVPVDAARALQAHLPVYPPPQALEAAQDRVTEKTFFNSVGIPTAPFASVNSLVELEAAAKSMGLPAVLKTRRLGYDGKGQAVLKDKAELASAFSQLGGKGLILEGFVKFDRELSIIAVRSRNGAFAAWPLVENHHREGILRLSLAPAPRLDPALQVLAEAHARRVLEKLDYVGVLAIEFFEVGGKLLANEMAPRVHNSGHWTIEGAQCSQFENHLRAVCGLPLGSTLPLGHCAMFNLIGDIPPSAGVLALSGVHMHLYGKQPRPGRKLGHITVVAPDMRALESAMRPIYPLAGL